MTLAVYADPRRRRPRRRWWRPQPGPAIPRLWAKCGQPVGRAKGGDADHPNRPV